MACWIGFLGVLGVLSSPVIYAESSQVPNKPMNLTVDNLMEPSADHGVIATLRWRVSPSNNPLKYYVRYREDQTSAHVQKIASTTSATIYLKPNSRYVVKVMAFDAHNPSLQGPWSDKLNVQTGDSVPTHAPLNVTATAVTSSSIVVKWSPIPQQYRNGKLLGYIVFYRKLNTRRWKTRQMSNSLILQYTLTGLPQGESYLVAVAGYTKIGVGKKSNAVTVDRSLPTTRPPPTTAPLTTLAPTSIQETTTSSSTTEVTTSNYVDNHIPKPTTKDRLVTYETHTVSETLHETTVQSPNAQANKDIQEKKTSSIALVYKFIIPAAIGGLVLVLLIVCIMWRQRKAKRRRNQTDDTISLTTLGDTRKYKDKTRCAVSRGEGSIRYAPPPKSYTTSAPPSQDDPTLNKFDESRTTLSVISESLNGDSNTPSQAEPTKGRRPYAEVTIAGNDKDERYVKRNDAPKAGYAEPIINKPVPSSPCKSTTSEAEYENMQHLYECLDVKDDQGSPLYMNVGTEQDDGEGLYEEIPAGRQDNYDEPAEENAVQQPLLDKQINEQSKTE